MLNSCIVKTQTFETFTLLYLTPLVYLRLWFWIRLPKLKRKEAGSLSKSERQKLQRLYTQSGAAYGYVRNLVKAGNLSVSKVRQFLHSKPSYAKFTPATRKIKQLKAFAGFKNEIWCIDLAYVDKLAKDNNGVTYPLVRQDLFDRTVDAKGLKTEDSKVMVRAFLSTITKKNRPKNLGRQRNRIWKRVWKTMQSWRDTNLLHDEWYQGCICWTYNTISEKYTLPLHGRQWLQVHSQIDSIRYNAKFWKKMLDRFDTKKKIPICCPFYTANHYENLDNPSLKVETKVASRCMTYPSGRVISHSLQKKVFEIVASSSKKPPTHTVKDEHDEIIRGKFYQKELIKVI